jgi:hypothetical protein
MDSVLPDLSSIVNYFFGEDLVIGAWFISIARDGAILPFLALDLRILIWGFLTGISLKMLFLS